MVWNQLIVAGDEVLTNSFSLPGGRSLNMASTESDTRTPSPDHCERKRPLDGDSDLSDRKKSHFTGGDSHHLNQSK